MIELEGHFSGELKELGIAVQAINDCMARIFGDRLSMVVMCRKVDSAPAVDPLEHPEPYQLMAGG